MKRIELLSPAGSFDCLKIAIDNGADAVYLGGKSFSARAFANNFSFEEIKEAVEYAHLRNVKIYITLNTLLTDNELDNAMKAVDKYYHMNVDALIIQDLGLYYRIKQEYPDFELHCSTQMHVHNISGIRNAKKLGFKRIVIPRESNLNFIRKACDEGIEIETFVHGALCVSYSGQCLMSSATIENRSANKGMCAACCRMRYKIYDEEANEYLKQNTSYLLSTADLCYIDHIGELIETGVASLKIEGRMKKSAYVGYITRLYREAIDAYYNHQEYHLSKEQINNMLVLFSRRFSDDYIKSDFSNLFDNKTPNHQGVYLGEVVGYKNGKASVKLYNPLHQFDGVRIGDSDNNGFIVNMMSVNGLLTDKADKGDIVEMSTKYPCKIGEKVNKTLDYLLEKDINDNSPSKKVDLEISITAKANDKLHIETKDGFRYDSSIIIQKAEKTPISKDTIIKQFSKTNEYPFNIIFNDIILDNAFLPISSINEIRRDFLLKYKEFKLASFKRQLVESIDLSNKMSSGNEIKPIIEYNGKIDGCITIGDDNSDYYLNSVINTNSIYHTDRKEVIADFGGILNDSIDKIAYYTLNVMNSYSYELLNKLGFTKIILSSEISDEAIDQLINTYRKRNSIDIMPYVLVYGSRALMYIKGNPFRDYIHHKGKFFLDDNHNRYEIVTKNEHFELYEKAHDFRHETCNKIQQFIIVHDSNDFIRAQKLIKTSTLNI